jgi:hypothetical protein
MFHYSSPVAAEAFGTVVEVVPGGRVGSPECDFSGRRWHRTHSVSSFSRSVRGRLRASWRRERQMRMLRRPLVLVILAVLTTSACALRSPSIADLQYNPGRYYNRNVNVEGVVTSSWGVPLVPLKVYKVGDSSGEITVVSDGSRVPPRGARVRVRGKVTEFGTFGGRAVGLHLREQSLHVLRRG